jgi:hypothetical protein
MLDELITMSEAAKLLGLKRSELKMADGDWRLGTYCRGKRVYTSPTEVRMQRDNWDMHLAAYPPGWPKRK